MPSSTLHQYFCTAWDMVWVFLFLFVFTLGPFSGREGALRAPGSGGKVLKFGLLSIGCLLCIFLSPVFGCQHCCGKYFPNKPAIDLPASENIKAVFAIAWGLSGFIAGAVREDIKYRKSRRLIHRFLSDCVADGSLRVMFEKHEPVEDSKWLVHDLRKKNSKDLRWLSGQVAYATITTTNYFAFKIDGKALFRRLAEYGLITQKDLMEQNYGFRPPSEFKHPEMLPRGGGSILQFYYNAEYVRIWG